MVGWSELRRAPDDYTTLVPHLLRVSHSPDTLSLSLSLFVTWSIPPLPSMYLPLLVRCRGIDNRREGDMMDGSDSDSGAGAIVESVREFDDDGDLSDTTSYLTPTTCSDYGFP